MEPLAWYIAGPLIGLFVPLLLILRGKQLGISSSFRAIGAQLFPNWNYFKYDWRKDAWQLEFALGIIIISFSLFFWTVIGTPIVSTETVYGQNAQNIYQMENAAIFFFGAVLIGFGARYADGCTAGHCIMGNAQGAVSSAITKVFFFIGGLIATHFIVPNLF